MVWISGAAEAREVQARTTAPSSAVETDDFMRSAPNAVRARMQLARRSEDEHRVAVTEKPILARDRVGIDVVQPGDAVRRAGREKRGDQTEQGGTRLVEIGDQRVD